MRVLDLYCRAGGASLGYVQAGCDVVGVDLHPQPRYPWPFLQMDALRLDARFLKTFDLVHASPPCQGYTDMVAPGRKSDHPRLIFPTRCMLDAAGVDYVIENVEGAAAHLRDPILLCGSHFGLGVSYGGERFQLRRHRLFETTFPLPQLACQHTRPTIGVYGAHVRARAQRLWRNGGRDFPATDKLGLAHEAMGMEIAMTFADISEAIPPAYTRWIAESFIFQNADPAREPRPLSGRLASAQP